MIKFLDLGEQYLSIKSDIDFAISKVLSNSSFIGGEHVAEFEENFADFQEVSHCIGVGNCTDALEIAIESLELPLGSEIIVPANSFIASAEAIVRAGCKPVFCDANSSDYTININDLIKRINDNTSAILIVHLYGHPCDVDEVIKIAQKFRLKIIEDCAQAVGSEYKGHKLGGLGDIGCFSFYPGKNLGAYGDAGAIVTNNELLAKKCRMIANHGRIAKYNHEFVGRNSRLDGIQAAILNVKLNFLNKWISHRNLVANLYLNELGSFSNMILPVKQKWAVHAYHLFVVRHQNRSSIIEKCSKLGIQTSIHYPIALPKLKAFKYLEQSEEKGFCWVEDVNLLSLPIGEHINLDSLKRKLEELTLL